MSEGPPATRRELVVWNAAIVAAAAAILRAAAGVAARPLREG